MMLSRNLMTILRTLVVLAVATFCFSSSSLAEVIVFHNGSQLEVGSYRVKSNLVVITTTEGKVRSVPLSLVDIEATREKNLRSISLASTGSGEPLKSQSLTNDRVTKVRELLESSAAGSLLNQLPTLIPAGIAQAEQLVPESGTKIDERLREALERNCRPKQVYENMLADFSRQAENSRLDSSLAWLRSPVSRRMIELDRLAKTPEGLRLLLGYASDLDEMPPAGRLEMLQRLDEAMGVTETKIGMQALILRAVFEGFNLTVPDDRKMSEEELNKTVQKAHARMRASIKNSSLVSLLFTYRSSSDKELGKFLAHWESDEGRWLSRSSRVALHAGVVQALQASKQSLGLQATRMRD